MEEEEPVASRRPLLEVEGLSTEFRTQRGIVKAVNGVSLTVHEGEIAGIVGESGSGKSALLRSLLGLISHPGHVVGGTARLDGEDLLTMGPHDLRRLRGARIGFVSQNPFGSLNPVLRIRKQFENVVRAHRRTPRAEIAEAAERLLASVGIREPARVLNGYAHELSGGMAQRVVIALATVLDPALVLADEPTTALDATVQRKVLDTMVQNLRGRGTSLLIVTHDLGVVAQYCQTVMVMYAGQVVERGPVSQVFTAPLHPYTRALLGAAPRPGVEPIELRGAVPDLIDYPPGCPFAARCEFVHAACTDRPDGRRLGEAEVWCHLPEGVSALTRSGFDGGR